MAELPVLDVRGVSRSFDDGHQSVVAVNDVSLSVDRGEMVAVMGASGSGKSTLLHLAGGLDVASSGRVLVEGTDLGSLSVAARATLRRRAIGVVFQEYNLLESLTAVENVSLPLELDNRRRAESRSAAIAALDEVGLGGLVDRFPADLSGGERQRVAIARGLVGHQVLVLADEPTGALDSINGEEVLRLLRRRCGSGAAALLVTHDARLAAWADRIVFLRDGCCVDETSVASGPEQLLGAEPR
ncbi:MAG: ABC transporter ATP-binding protein [bacterium]|nr:ABC transporter ATP-binding protein [bacterium]